MPNRTYLLGLLAGAATTVGIAVLANAQAAQNGNLKALAAVAAFIGGLLLVVFSLRIVMSGVDAERRVVARASERQDDLLRDIRQVKGVPTLAELVDFNARQMRVYQELSTGQASSSYRRSQLAFIVGLALIGAAIAASFAGSDPTTKLTAGAAAGLGAVCSAYISATYLRVYERALDQLNFYYRQPLINSYLLTAERLANDMSDQEKRDAAYDELLRQVLSCARTPEPPVDANGGPGRSRGSRNRRPKLQARTPRRRL
jgi:hypothetical protein